MLYMLQPEKCIWKIKGNRLTRSFVCLAVLTVNGWTGSACLAEVGAKPEPKYETFIADIQWITL